MTLFTRLSQLVASEGDRLQCEIIGAQGGQIKVRITPILGPVPTNALPEEIELRLLMATPLTILGLPHEVDALLEEHLTKRAQIQSCGADALTQLSAKMAAATQNAQSAKPAAASKGPSAKAAAAPAEAPQEEVAPRVVTAPTLDDSF